MTLSFIDPFPANHCSAFFITTPFRAISILTILLHEHYNQNETFLFERRCSFFEKAFI